MLADPIRPPVPPAPQATGRMRLGPATRSTPDPATTPATAPATAPSDERPGPTSSGRAVAAITGIGASTGVTFWLVGRAIEAVAAHREAPWILGRATGVTSYLLLVTLVCTGLVLAHPWRARLRRPGQVTRIRIHVALATFALAFTALHVVVLATDPYAKVGWWGALLPMASEYRPLAVTLGVIAGYGGLLAGCTAALAGRWAGRAWWPLHRAAAVLLVLAWAHAVLAGTDTPALRGLYLGTSVLVILLAAARYLGAPDRKAP
jgi:hypothetical protein